MNRFNLKTLMLLLSIFVFICSYSQEKKIYRYTSHIVEAYDIIQGEPVLTGKTFERDMTIVIEFEKITLKERGAKDVVYSISKWHSGKNKATFSIECNNENVHFMLDLDKNILIQIFKTGGGMYAYYFSDN